MRSGRPRRPATRRSISWRSFPLSPSPAHIRSTIASVVGAPDELRELRAFHKALADVNRLRIVRRLADGEATVTELIGHVGLSQPLVSWHLGRLRLARLVETRRSGRETIWRLLPDAFDEYVARERSLLGLGRVPEAGMTGRNGSNGTDPTQRANGAKKPRAAVS